MDMSIIGYARVSSSEQSLDIQIEKLKEYGCTKILKVLEDSKTKTVSQILKDNNISQRTYYKIRNGKYNDVLESK